MANFKLYSVAAAALAFAGIASAQTAPSSCTASAPFGANIIRAEGTTEQVGELNAVCTAGPGGATSFQVQFPANTTVTSKVLSTSGSNNTVDAFIAFGTTPTSATNTVPLAATYSVVNGVVNTSTPNIVTFSVTLPVGAVTYIQFGNLRINASALGAASYTPVSANLFSINTVVQTSVSTVVSYVLSGITKATANGSTSASSTTSLTNPVVCTTRYGYTSYIYYAHFSEGFAQSFKTAYGSSLVVSGGVTSPSPNTTATGVLGSEVNNNTEGGVAANALSGGVTSATRLAVTLTGLPNATVYLPLVINDDSSTTNANTYVGRISMISNPTLPNSLQATVSGTTSSNSPDKGGTAATALPAVGTIGTPAFAAFTPTNGTVTAYYEVLYSTASAVESYTIPVAVYYSANSIAPAATATGVLVSFAPTGTTNVPNFAASANSATSASKFPGCTTTLLFPYLVNAAGFDTGLTISNTSVDPFGTGNQNGACTLYYYNGAAGSAGNTVSPSFTVNAGTTYANLMSVLNPGFTGYAIAQCTFQYAHGFAFITDGFASPGRGLSQGYLALAIPDPNQNSRSSFVAPTGNTESLGN